VKWEDFDGVHMSGEQDTERVAVKTYVPAYQKAEWESHAADLNMSQSEFVRTMVQAGRSGFEVNSAEPQHSDADPGGEPLEIRLVDILESGPKDWDELLEAVTADLEDRLDEALGQLQESNTIRYSGRDGGYMLVGDSG
jgi:hypothetical protein